MLSPTTRNVLARMQQSSLPPRSYCSTKVYMSSCMPFVLVKATQIVYAMTCCVQLPGVQSVSVNLLLNSAMVTLDRSGAAGPRDVIEAIDNAGMQWANLGQYLPHVGYAAVNVNMKTCATVNLSICQPRVCCIYDSD